MVQVIIPAPRRPAPRRERWNGSRVGWLNTTMLRVVAKVIRSSKRRQEARRRGKPYRSLVTAEPKHVKMYFIQQFLPRSTREAVFPMRAMILASIEIQRLVIYIIDNIAAASATVTHNGRFLTFDRCEDVCCDDGSAASPGAAFPGASSRPWRHIACGQIPA